MGVLRYDQASPLSKPVRLPNGFMRAEGYLTRSGGDTRVGQSELYRVVRIVTPQKGAWSGRVTGFEW